MVSVATNVPYAQQSAAAAECGSGGFGCPAMLFAVPRRLVAIGLLRLVPRNWLVAWGRLNQMAACALRSNHGSEGAMKVINGVFGHLVSFPPDRAAQLLLTSVN